MDELRDIHVPEAPWWHIPTGYWLLLLACIIAVIFLIVIIRRSRIHHEQADQLRMATIYQAALDELAHIEAAYAAAHTSYSETATQLTTLLRRVALQQFGRQQCAGLSGNAWLAFLLYSGGLRIPKTAQALVALGQYQNPQSINHNDHNAQTASITALVTFLRHWFSGELDIEQEPPISYATINAPLVRAVDTTAIAAEPETGVA